MSFGFRDLICELSIINCIHEVRGRINSAGSYKVEFVDLQLKCSGHRAPILTSQKKMLYNN